MAIFKKEAMTAQAAADVIMARIAEIAKKKIQTFAERTVAQDGLRVAVWIEGTDRRAEKFIPDSAWNSEYDFGVDADKLFEELFK